MRLRRRDCAPWIRTTLACGWPRQARIPRGPAIDIWISPFDSSPLPAFDLAGIYSLYHAGTTTHALPGRQRLLLGRHVSPIPPYPLDMKSNLFPCVPSRSVDRPASRPFRAREVPFVSVGQLTDSSSNESDLAWWSGVKAPLLVPSGSAMMPLPCRSKTAEFVSVPYLS